MRKYFLWVALCTAMWHHGASPAANRIDRQTVEISRKTPTVTLRGKIRGYDTAEYIVRLRQGQALSVSLQTNSRSNYVNITGPNRAGEALFIGSRDGNRYRGTLPESGSYTIQVYLMRNAARRGERASYVLSVGARE
jgi:hypothetical protein